MLLFSVSGNKLIGQNSNTDNLKQKLASAKEDTAKVNLLFELAASYKQFFGGYGFQNQPDSAIRYVQKALLLASSIHYPQGEANGLMILGKYNADIGNYSQSITFLLKALAIYKQLKDEDGLAAIHQILTGTYINGGDYKNALLHQFAAKQLIERQDRKGTIILKGIRMLPFVEAGIGETYLYMNALDSAEFFARESIDQNLKINGANWNYPIYLLGTIQVKQGKYNEALENYRIAIPLAVKNVMFKDTLDIYNSIAELYKIRGNTDSAIYYAKAITNNWNSISMLKILLTASTTLAEAYKLKNNSDSALKYLELSNTLKDSIYSQEKQREFQSVVFNEQLKNQEKQQELQQVKEEIRLYILISGLLVLAVITYILYRSNSNKQKAYALLQKQKQDTDHQKTKAEEALQELQATQTQLIQREKMASLGELTAGIAHEIQNPLNFVNNFSEVNAELIEELKSEKAKVKSERDERLENELLHNIADNEKKINHHGKRADAIVKGMLQHSQSSVGVKESTDINKLADEYLRLAYHGLKAKDKSFNATIKTNFDATIGNINIIPQDIGRVILNLINNAFYAVDEKRHRLDKSYEPCVWVSTRNVQDKVEVKVKDNGNGIPQEVLDKIFQPFFTTKPTGQGTGLGLSLAYDIITKGHGGELKVETKQGEGSEFIIQIPIKDG